MGATFTLSLPLVSSTRPAVASGADGEVSSPISLGGITVLVVDDEADAREPAAAGAGSARPPKCSR
jgi:hypothetical protein